MSAKESALRHIDPKEIRRNPNNPRVIFYDKDMELLRESIDEVGILVPLIVYRSEKSGNYYLLDGERRWRCALKLGLSTVPANIIPEPDLKSNLLTMFNIHNVRVAWELTPTALKLEMLMRLLDNADDKRLARLTGLKPSYVRRCKTLLKFDKRYLDMTLEATQNKLTGDFFVELYPVLNLIEKNLPEISESYSRDDIIESMITKYRAGGVSAVTEFRRFRDLIRLVKKGVSEKVISTAVRRLLKDPGLSIEESYDDVASSFYEVQKIIRSSRKLEEALLSIDTSDVLKKKQLTVRLTSLKNTIEKLLRRLNP